MVRAVAGLLLIGLPALVVALFVRSGEGLIGRISDRRWARTLRRADDARRRRKPGQQD